MIAALMTTRILRLCALFLAMLMRPAAASSGVTVLLVQRDYVVAADGRFTRDDHVRLRIDSAQGIQQRSQMSFPFSASLARLDLIEAATIGPRGGRTPVQPDQVRVQQSPLSAAAPMYDDGQVMTVVFPAVEVGSTLEAKLRWTQLTPLFPGHFATLEAPEYQSENRRMVVSLRAPASLALKTEARGFSGGRESVASAGEQRWQWTLDGSSPLRFETSSVAAVDHGPRLAVSTLPDYAALGRVYAERAGPQAAVTPAILALAEQLVARIPPERRRERAEALYRWVSSQIRYVAIFLGAGAVVPHSAQAVLDYRYGDCKDHVVLLEALLAAVGIDSRAVLVNAGDSYELPGVALAPGLFNHVISYLPEFDLFVDSTAAVARFGQLPFTELGKTALIVGRGAEPARLARLPGADPAHDQVEIDTTLTLDPQGNLYGASSVKLDGVFDLFHRQILGGLPVGAHAQIGQQLLAHSGQTGTGSLRWSPEAVAALDRAFGFSATFQLPGYALLPGPGALSLPQGLAGFARIGSSLEAFTPATREQPVPLLSRHIVEWTHLHLPEGLAETLRLPPPVAVTTKGGHYESSYERHGDRVEVRRALELDLPHVLILPPDYAEMRRFVQAVNRDLRAQIVY